MVDSFNKYVLPSFLLIVLLAACFLDSASSQQLLDEVNPVSLAGEEEESEPVIAEEEQQEASPHQSKNFELQQKLVDREVVNGYIVETYREYEVYKDEKGNVTKSIPTANYEYIRYKQY